MTALALRPGMDRAEAARWTLCFATVVAVHSLAVLWFLPSHQEASDFDAGAPVVMLELPELQATSATPPNDLAPGPTEAESAPTPPKEEQTKPPEEEAEVALPIPEPPTPAPPTVASPPTAQPSVTMPAVAALPTPGAEVVAAAIVHRWESALVAHIERFKRYPSEARAHDERGVARVAFTIDHDGRIVASRIIQSSGYADLDNETLAMLDRAQPMPRPPAKLADSQLSFVVPVRFNIR
jgi:periplasmic protein TonB